MAAGDADELPGAFVLEVRAELLERCTAVNSGTYWITSSARAIIELVIVRPRAFAVLTTSSYGLDTRREQECLSRAHGSIGQPCLA